MIEQVIRFTNIAKSYIRDASAFKTDNSREYLHYAAKEFDRILFVNHHRKTDFTKAILFLKSAVRKIDKWVDDEDEPGVVSKLNSAKTYIEMVMRLFQEFEKTAKSEKVVDILETIRDKCRDDKISVTVTAICQAHPDELTSLIRTLKRQLSKYPEQAGYLKELEAALLK